MELDSEQPMNNPPSVKAIKVEHAPAFAGVPASAAAAQIVRAQIAGLHPLAAVHGPAGLSHVANVAEVKGHGG